MPQHRISARMGMSLAAAEKRAVDEIRQQIEQPGPFLTLFFCSPSYHLPQLGAELLEVFPGGVVGCTSAGQIGPTGFQRGGITAVSIGLEAVEVTPYALGPLRLASAQAVAIGAGVRARRAGPPGGRGAFGLLLIDGLSLAEERVAASLFHVLGDVPLIGGSAGDDLAFRETFVFVDGEFRRDAAVLLLFETMIPFRAFKFQHFAPTGVRLVVTGADPDRRVVTEINGEPAAEVYARLIGRSIGELTAEVFAQHPVMLKLGRDYYVRSIQKVNVDDSLTFFCAIEAGIVLHMGRGVDVIQIAEAALSPEGARPDLVLGCDRILRRLELEQRGLDGPVGDLFVKNRVFGFSTYGEQYAGVHVNQTFTGVSFGGDAA